MNGKHSKLHEKYSKCIRRNYLKGITFEAGGQQAKWVRFCSYMKSFIWYAHKMSRYWEINDFLIEKKDFQHIINSSAHLYTLYFSGCLVSYDSLNFRKDIEFKINYITFEKCRSFYLEDLDKNHQKLEILLEAISKWSLKDSLRLLKIEASDLSEKVIKKMLVKYKLKTLMVSFTLSGQLEYISVIYPVSSCIIQ